MSVESASPCRAQNAFCDSPLRSYRASHRRHSAAPRRQIFRPGGLGLRAEFALLWCFMHQPHTDRHATRPACRRWYAYDPIAIRKRNKDLETTAFQRLTISVVLRTQPTKLACKQPHRITWLFLLAPLIQVHFQAPILLIRRQDHIIDANGEQDRLRNA